jgi:hypothetical protein
MYLCQLRVIRPSDDREKFVYFGLDQEMIDRLFKGKATSEERLGVAEKMFKAFMEARQ